MCRLLITLTLPATNRIQVLVRPSFVLSGAAMSVASTPAQLLQCLSNAEEVSGDKPVVLSKYIVGAKEMEFDAVILSLTFPLPVP